MQLPHSSGLGSPIFGHVPLMPPTAELGGVGSLSVSTENE